VTAGVFTTSLVKAAPVVIDMERLKAGMAQAILHYAQEIYAADVWLLSSLVRANPASLNALLMVGHNPVLANFGAWLTNEPMDFLPTCGLLAIGFNVDEWTGIDRGKGRLLWRSEDRGQGTGVRGQGTGNRVDKTIRP